MSSGLQLSPRPSLSADCQHPAKVVLDRRPSLGAGSDIFTSQPVTVLPISTRDTRTSSCISSSSLRLSLGRTRATSSFSIGVPSAASRRRTSSVFSVVNPRKETWANISTPDAHWHPSGVSGLSFGFEASAPLEDNAEPPRRRISSLVSTIGLAAAQVSVAEAPAAGVTTQAAPAVMSQPAQVPLGYPSPYGVAQPPFLATPPQQLPQPAPYVYDVSTAAPAVPAVGAVPASAGAPVMMPGQAVPASAGAPVMMPGQAMQMQCGSYMQAPGGGFVFLGMVPAATVQAAPAAPQAPAPVTMQQQAQPLRLSSLISESSGYAVSPAVSQTTTVGQTKTVGQTTTTTTVVKAAGQEPVTTCMLRNIPQKYDREQLVEVLNKTGFAGTYDFFYLPIDFSTTNSVGYAFINFVNPAELARFRAAYVGKKLSEESPKVCEVSDAKLQGRDKNVEFYRNSTVMGMDEKYHPLLLESGVRLPFPKPTRPIGPVLRRPARVHPKH